MAVPDYDELLVKRKVTSSAMERTFDDDDLLKFSLELDRWEMLARFLGIPNPKIENIKSQGDMEEQKINMLVCWKQKHGSEATYGAMVKALLQISRTDLAEKVITLRCPSRDTVNTLPDNQTEPSTSEPSQATPPSPGSSSGISEDMSPQTPAALLPLTVLSNTNVHPAQQEVVISHLRELEEEFYELVKFTEATLKNNEINLETILRRFSMLPQSIRRQHRRDENFVVTKRRILGSQTIKELFDNLTELKHWSFMIPDTLIYIVQDVKNDDIKQKIDKYTSRLTAFKTKTDLRDLIGLQFPVPDYCIELIIEVDGWEDKTIDEAEKATLNILRQATYHGGIGLKGVLPGSTKMIFIFLGSTADINIDGLLGACKVNGVISIHIEEEEVFSKLKAHPMPIQSDSVSDEDSSMTKIADGEIVLSSKFWGESNSAWGGRDVLIIYSDLPSHNPEAVPRRSSNLTIKDKQTLHSQGVPPDCQDERAIVKARYLLDKRFKIVGVKSGKMSREEIMECIRLLLTTTKNDGVVFDYIGAGRRNTGDWCFENGFITFRDITQLYLRASHNFKGRVLTIDSDCSYSGCWVRDCMEFLDEQGVQPCGHKAREKGMIIKVFCSCQSNEVPTEYCQSVSGVKNDKNTGKHSLSANKLSETQKPNHIDSSMLRCKQKTIDEPCTLQPGYTWRKFSVGSRIFLVRGKDRGRPAWHYVLLIDDEDVKTEFRAKVASGRVDVADYGQVLKSGWGKDPPNEVKEEIDKECNLSENC